MKKIFTLVLFLCFTLSIFSQFESPKHELRGVWIAALGIDWPSAQGTNSSTMENQKNQLTTIFNQHKSYGLNAIFLHMRPLCDALYKSNIEPWSHYITGTQGTPPSDPNYDPLQFAVEEAHKRGMELHAWLNPYRAMSSGGSPTSANHVVTKYPAWIIKCNGSEYRFLNPGLPEVREYVVSVVMDIVRRYDVDGIHFDDYFYPYAAYGTFNDDATFNKYPNGFTNRAAWRKNNVSLLVKMLNDSIKAEKPWVKFGISPSGNPSVNNEIFCDPAPWLKGTYTDSNGAQQSGDPYVDYIMPQLYWARYAGYLGTWASSSFLNGRHLYVGQAAYRYATSEFPSDEAGWEVTTNRENSAIRGGVYFSSKSLTGNLGYGADTLKYKYFTHPAIPPKMEWIEAGIKKPNAPSNLRFEVNSTTGKHELHWDKPAPTPGGDTAFAYVIYRSENNPPDPSDPSNIFGITGTTFLSATDARYSVTKGTRYIVTAIDRYSNESVPGNVATLDLPALIPSKPVLSSPANGFKDLGYSASLVWQADANAERYLIQVAKDPSFNSDVVLLMAEYSNTQLPFRNIIPGDIYYWRVKAFGQVGESEYSDVFSFQSGIPFAPILNLPDHTSTDVSLTPEFSWFKIDAASSYRFQVATTVQFYDNSIIINKVLSDTFYQVAAPLAANKIHYWRVSATNSFGTSPWSEQRGFKTTPVTDVENEAVPTEYSLKQNYPNPFNPSTIISWQLPAESHVRLKIFNVLGKEVASLVDVVQQVGNHKYEFNAVNLPSGIYFYKIEAVPLNGNHAANFISTRKMIVIK